MQVSAVYQSVLELLTEIFKDKEPADHIINDYTRSRKYIGSKDRRLITDTVWQIVRSRMRLSYEAGSENPRKILLLFLKDKDFSLITGGQYGLQPLDKAEEKWLEKAKIKEDVYPLNVELECPKWLFEKIDHPALIRSLNDTAPFNIRANLIDRLSLQKRLKAEGLFFSLSPYSPIGLQSSERIRVNNSTAYHDGLFDVQDESSQLAALLCNVKKNEKIVDYCAGAGGKSLALGAILQNEGSIDAHDIDITRMEALRTRALRLGIKNIQLQNEITATDYDCFIADSPCSGSGTWRRSPDAKFRLIPDRLKELTKIQADILEKAYQHTKNSGRIIYMTCSVLKEENEDIVMAFAHRHDDVCFSDHEGLWNEIIGERFPFTEKKWLNFSPFLTQTDGFFFCSMLKKR